MTEHLTAEQWIAFHLSSVQQALLSIGLPILLALTGLLIVRKVVRQHHLREHHDLAGPFLCTVGTIFGIFLAFIVADTWHYYDLTGSNIVQEARCLESLHNHAVAFPVDARPPIHDALRRYRDSLVSKEWPCLAKGSGSPEVDAALRDLTHAYAGVNVTGSVQSSFYNQSVTTLDQLKALRASRIDDAASGLLPFLWVIVLLGASLTIGFSYLFGAQNFPTHAAMVFLLTAMIALAFYTILTLDFPFTGPAAIGPEAFAKLDL